jgi:sugar phosphate isomerase/epimerase
MWDRLASERFFCVLDVMHCSYHRESVPVAIKKLGSRLGILQICGTDGETLSHLPITNDNASRDILRHLKEANFKGIVDVELYGMPTEAIDESYQQAREILERQLLSLN